MARFAPLLALSVLALPAAASLQTQVPPEKKYFSTWAETPYEVFHPGLPEPVEDVRRLFRGLQMGSLDEGNSPDGLVLHEVDGTLKASILTNPGQFNHSWPLGQVTDAALLRGAGLIGRDAVLSLSTQTGLDLTYVSVSPQGVESLVTQNVRSSAVWKSAQKLWVVRESAMVQDVIALAADGMTALRLGFASGIFQDEAPMVAPYGLSRVLAVDYDGTGLPELLFWSDPYLFLLSWSGSVIGYLNAAMNPNDWVVPAGGRRFVTVIPGQANPTSAATRDLIAVHLWDSATSTFYVMTFNAGVALNWFAVGPGADLANHSWDATATDYDGDDLSELILCSGSSNAGNLLRRTGAIPTLMRSDTLGSALAFTTGPSLPSMGARAVAAADIDQDGDQDILTLAQPEGNAEYARPGVQSFFSDRFNGRRLELSIMPGALEELGENTYQVQLKWDPPANLTQMSPAPTHVLLQAWVEQDTSVPSTTDTQRVLRQEVPFSGSGDALLTLQTAAPLDLEYCAVHLHVGLVTRSGGSITHVHPSQLVYAYQGATAEFKLGWRISYENGEVGPGGGSCGTGCTIGNGGGNTSPGPGPQPRN